MSSQGSGRTCAFCAGKIGKDAPPEHVLPQWLARMSPKGVKFHHVIGPEMLGDEALSSANPDFTSARFELTADTVCWTCNHRWMSDLETRCSDHLKPMIEGRPVGLTPERQALLSQWVAKTACTWDQSRKPGRRTIPLDFSRWLYRHRLPPPSSLIRLAKFSNPEVFVQMMYHGLGVSGIGADDIAADGVKAHRATIRIGELVMEFTVAKDPEALVEVGGGDIADLLITIWPTVETTAWPPRLIFSDAALRTFMDPKGEPPTLGHA